MLLLFQWKLPFNRAFWHDLALIFDLLRQASGRPVNHMLAKEVLAGLVCPHLLSPLMVLDQAALGTGSGSISDCADLNLPKQAALILHSQAGSLRP